MAYRCRELSLSNDQLLDPIGHLVERRSGLAYCCVYSVGELAVCHLGHRYRR